MERTVWLLGLVLLVAFVLCGMRRGWVQRASREARWSPEIPQPPRDRGETLLNQVTGLYVGTTTAGAWQNRIAAGDIGNRASAGAELCEHGLLIERAGSRPLWIPATAFRDARVDHKLANTLVAGAGMLVVTWQLGDHLLDTGFRVDGEPTQREWADAIRSEGTRSEISVRNETASAR